MRVLIDENLSPALARALDALFAGEHEVVHMRAKFGPGVSDVHWITTLDREGRWVLISGDRRITRNRAEYNAFRGSKLIGFFLSKGLYKSPVTKQAERILALWPALHEITSVVEGGAMFELPARSTRIRQLKL